MGAGTCGRDRYGVTSGQVIVVDGHRCRLDFSVHHSDGGFELGGGSGPVRVALGHRMPVSQVMST
jgi:hypothetical protein